MRGQGQSPLVSSTAPQGSVHILLAYLWGDEGLGGAGLDLPAQNIDKLESLQPALLTHRTQSLQQKSAK
jgi:hypothetical protein